MKKEYEAMCVGCNYYDRYPVERDVAINALRHSEGREGHAIVFSRRENVK